MPKVTEAKPQISVRLYKTINRQTLDGKSAVSVRYSGKDEYIDLTPFLAQGSSVVTTKSVRDPAGVFAITFADKPHNGGLTSGMGLGMVSALESVYGLVEPMDVVEIRMWHGVGPKPAVLPIKMRGFVSDISRQQSVSDNGIPARQVVVSGHDYGKIWQMYQVLYLPAYAGGTPLLSSYALMEMFNVDAKNAYKAGEFVRTMVQKVVNKHLQGFMPENTPMPREIQTGDSIAVKHGVVNISSQSVQGAIYDILKTHGDVGVWNELYTEDREDGVHCVYRPIPALHITKPDGAKSRKIQDDAPDPVYVLIPDEAVQSISCARSDANVANFYWVDNARFDLASEIYRKLFGIAEKDSTVYLKDYPNAAVKYYGIRPMYASTQQGDDNTQTMTSGQDAGVQAKRDDQTMSWLEKRRKIMVEMNRDNVVLERGTARIKGGPMRPDGKESMKAGDYAKFRMGNLEYSAYVTQIVDEFLPFDRYTTMLTYERGEGFITRAEMEGGVQSPWLAEQATRGANLFRGNR